MRYAEICAIAKDEEHTLADWVDYHLCVGFERVTVFDNNSAVPVERLLRGHVEHGLVRVIPFPAAKNQQLSAYFSYLKQFAGQARWTAFLDVDEYLVPKRVDDVRDLLQDYEDRAGLAAHWVMFGSDGHLSRPRESVPSAYRRALHRSETVKSIVDTSQVTHPRSPHHFGYAPGRCCVNEHGIPVDGPFSYHTAEILQVNHYYFQSQQDFCAKMERGFATPVEGREGYSLEEFFRQARQEGTPDDAIQRPARALERLRGKPLEVLAHLTLADASTTLDTWLERVTRLVAASRAGEALKACRKARRYRSDPALSQAEARLHALLGDERQALATLRAAFLEFGGDPAARADLYRGLAACFKALGKTEQAASIERELGR
ncbi:hypothetical protein NNJEOMEG_01182 [Fundidesulfovibrio magnetotacticus]|uniref:Glycosyl transferase family 2 n=1 Tax=Fundidesulfovibrio magnetotacticus TaxID=2730080 RepID=A0A6V8LQT5_9BACT|nr:glycosyltransferase family 92 protein [Fundidesulfovibrio magnetotacticus]GFK93350.1 hypothetical protein NNJEOMEG_01182 [Fundidesulfovibrio magnetotacticus]